MNRHMTFAVISALALSFALPAFSQSFPNLPLRNPRQLPDGYIQVQSGLSLSLPVTDGDTEKQQQEALRSFYRIAADNCTILLDTIAESCEISNLSSNADINDNSGRGPRLVIRGQITMSVKLKPPTGTPK